MQSPDIAPRISVNNPGVACISSSWWRKSLLVSSCENRQFKFTCLEENNVDSFVLTNDKTGRARTI
jgi:hypothetical protein